MYPETRLTNCKTDRWNGLFEPDIDPFPEEEALSQLLVQNTARNTLPPMDVCADFSVYQPPHLPILNEVARSIPQKDVTMGGLDGADERLPPTRRIVEPIAESFKRKERSRFLPPYSDGGGRKISVDQVLNAKSHAHEVSPSVETVEDTDSKPSAETKVSFTANPDIIPNPSRRQSNRNHGSNLSKAELGKIVRAISGQTEEVKDVTDRDRFAEQIEVVEVARKMNEAFQVAEKKKSDHDKTAINQPPSQEKPSHYNLALLVLRAEKGRWLKEDEEYKIMLRSEQTQLLEGRLPYSRRSSAVENTILREDDKLKGWFERAGMEKVTPPAEGGPVETLDADKDPNDVESGVPHLRRSPPRSPTSSSCGSSYVTVTQETVSICGRVNAVAASDDGQKARSLAIAAAYANRPSDSCPADGAASGDIADESTEPFHDHIEESEPNEAQMPFWDMSFSGGTAVPSQSANRFVEGPVGVVGGGSSPNGEQMVAQSHQAMGVLREALGGVRMAFSHAEIKHSDLAKEA